MSRFHFIAAYTALLVGSALVASFFTQQESGAIKNAAARPAAVETVTMPLVEHETGFAK